MMLKEDTLLYKVEEVPAMIQAANDLYVQTRDELAAARAEADRRAALLYEARQERDTARAEHEGLRLANRLLAADLNAARAEAERLRELVRECREAMKPLAGGSDPVHREEFRPLLQRIEAELDV